MGKITGFIRPSNITGTKYRRTFIENFKDMFILGDIYQFGVFSGLSIVDILHGFKSSSLEYNKVWGFDSFCGLPKEEKESLFCPEWDEGEFSSCEYVQVQDPKKASEIIKQHVVNEIGKIDIEFLVGFFKDSLKPNNEFKPASLIDIDVDIYSSALEGLDFMCENKLVVPGTMIIYDDWKGESLGEGRAHLEICSKFGLKCKHLCGWGERMYVVEEV